MSLFVYVFCLSHLSLDLYFFFFFKQKTAYEMRISDWSSDVCSSDLQFRVATLLGHFGFSERAAKVAYRLFLEHRDNSQAWMTLLGQEIGRASCRERVCQYV